MDKQVIVTIGREYGSAGHEIGEELAKRLNIKFYDRAIIEDIAKETGLDKGLIEKYDEKSRVPFISRTVRGFSNSIEDVIFELQCQFIREKADKGESFVLIGRAGDGVLRDRPYHIPVFIRGDKEEKLARIMEKYSLDREDALDKMKRHDKTRKEYHNSKFDTKWGDSRTYDLCINSSPVGLESTIDILEKYVRSRVEKFENQ